MKRKEGRGESYIFMTFWPTLSHTQVTLYSFKDFYLPSQLSRGGSCHSLIMTAILFKYNLHFSFSGFLFMKKHFSFMKISGKLFDCRLVALKIHLKIIALREIIRIPFISWVRTSKNYLQCSVNVIYCRACFSHKFCSFIFWKLFSRLGIIEKMLWLFAGWLTRF